MDLAPIIISVYTRENHFRRCIESLAKNTLADQSVLYIASDAGKTEEDQVIVEGIRNYVKTVTGFKEVVLIAHEKNIGARANAVYARNLVFEKYDKMIRSEDDNIFAPNFLEFINKGLEKYKDDKQVFAINGYRHFYNIKYSDNNYFMQGVDFSAWGYGIWKDRVYEKYSICTGAFIRHSLLNPVSLLKIYQHGYQKLFHAIVMSLRSGQIHTDVSSSLYMIITRKVVVMPIISKVRNIGWDDSRTSTTIYSKLIDRKHIQQPIDDQLTFEYHGDGHNFFEENRKCYVKENYAKMSFGKMLTELYLLFFRKYIRKL